MAILYTTYEDVKARLVGKVRFTADPLDENKMQVTLAERLIEEAEGQVEQDLSPRYAAPFVDTTAGTFAALPERPTKNILRTLCELKACIRILETDFGSGSAVDASKYIKTASDRYDAIIKENILAKYGDDYNSSRQWKFPPLPGLKKNWFNKQADDGYVGVGPLVTSDSSGDYAEGQINDPSEDFFNGRIRE